MRGNNVLGLIFSNFNEEKIREITERRTMGSVPFGGRYRLIDFTLSNMVNSGISRVGVITKSNYQSLMDHLGSGKPWDLSRRRDGLFILPPFFGGSTGEYTNRLDSLDSISRFVKESNEYYVLLSDSDVILNIDYREIIRFANKNNADITLLYKNGKVPENSTELKVLSMDEKGRVNDIIIDPNTAEEYSYAYNIMLVKRDVLLRQVRECCSRNKKNFSKDFLQANTANLRVFGYEFKGYSHIVSSMNEYYNANMDMMKSEVRKELFDKDRPIYTKVRDDMPTQYGKNSVVKNSIIANGCVIEGKVENSILFKGVHIEEDVVIKNCVVMQDSRISKGSRLNYIIIDKDSLIKSDRKLMGFESYPIYISKESVV
eukprot:TRINITY_DN363_c0_g1_i2.p1 TRINITY_DN363_c0_g1~~TRINITY_DN363_c0_g1_i2.p1  ORF type:complete len:373 (+),score=-49.91 TRINITY_DN363_c0_g1_i2:87-1205(+)